MLYVRHESVILFLTLVNPHDIVSILWLLCFKKDINRGEDSEENNISK